MPSYQTVTELPGHSAHKDQIDALHTRYSWASTYCRGKEVLEIACGSGIGLGFLGASAKSVVGGDIDEEVLKYGRAHYQDRSNIKLISLDACNMGFSDNSFDVAICFEAIYYFPSIADFLNEVWRILRPGGIFLCNSVNCQWHGFNPSPFSQKYLTVREIRKELARNGFSAESFVAFQDVPSTITRRMVSLIRATAVKLHLVPKTMKGKQFFKRLFYGKLKPLPAEITQSNGKYSPLIDLDSDICIENFKCYFFKAHKPT